MMQAFKEDETNQESTQAFRFGGVDVILLHCPAMSNINQ
jgi:hypothetical protein